MGLDWWLLNLILLVGKLDTRYSPSHQIHGMWFLLIRKQIESGTILFVIQRSAPFLAGTSLEMFFPSTRCLILAHLCQNRGTPKRTAGLLLASQSCLKKAPSKKACNTAPDHCKSYWAETPKASSQKAKSKQQDAPGRGVLWVFLDGAFSVQKINHQSQDVHRPREENQVRSPSRPLEPCPALRATGLIWAASKLAAGSKLR